MDLYKAIRELVEERNRIDKIITSLEEMLARGNTLTAGKHDKKPAVKRRGRKSMSPEERKQVSERMARYWAARRGTKDDDAPSEEEPSSQSAATS